MSNELSADLDSNQPRIDYPSQMIKRYSVIGKYVSCATRGPTINSMMGDFETITRSIWSNDAYGTSTSAGVLNAMLRCHICHAKVMD